VSELVKRRVRARDSKTALKRARKKYKSMTVTKVNWLPNVSKNKKGEKMYAVIAHKRKVKR